MVEDFSLFGVTRLDTLLGTVEVFKTVPFPFSNGQVRSRSDKTMVAVAGHTFSPEML